uniref:PGG domain-containing protein n=1 Tax=Lactuca sativa TaxID=4236 RepID=A0A9R1UUQ1_LACSA|nr:hypothetical protein LSAT_V11C800450820 [Lactuca sativa]
MKGSRDDYIKILLPLYEASVTCDWDAAKAIIDKRPELVRFAITDRYETALHIAASAEPTKLAEEFLKNLVNMMEEKDLELENRGGDNALFAAAVSGSPKMVDILLKRHKGMSIPLAASTYCGNHNMARYLYDASEKMKSLTQMDRIFTLNHCVTADMFDIALKILTDYPEIMDAPAESQFILDALSGKVDAVNKKEPIIIWKIVDSIFAKLYMKKRVSKKDHQALNLLTRVLNSTIKFNKLVIDKILFRRVEDGVQKYSGIVFNAAAVGNTCFIIELIRIYPHVIWMPNDDGHTIFHIAIMHRHQGIYNLLYEIGSRKYVIASWTDKKENTILHLLGLTIEKVQLQTQSRVSLLLQRDLLWFHDVEKMLPPPLREHKNKEGQTAYQLFFENNKDLVSGSLKWMKDSMVVATLIVTVAFAVAFTIPGGYDQENGFPIFIHEPTFLVFIIADAISLFSSSTSLLVFLSIITSNYGQRDFLYSLPRKLVIGLVTLFISVAAMMLTFVASFFVLYRNGLKWVPIIIGILAAMPVIVFAALQFPVWLDMFRSMYDSRYIFHPKRNMLYNKNPRL